MATCLRLQRSCRLRLPSRRLASLSQRQSESAQVVVVGGGVVGVSVAYHLAKAGTKDVLVLEKSELTAGSTWHAAGLTTYFNPGINARRLHYHSLKLYEQLETETGLEVGLHKPGSLRLITSQVRMDEAKYQMSRSRWCQAEQHLIGPNECERLCPLLDMSSVLGGIYTPNDGHVDPYSVTMAMAAAARKHGAVFRQNCQVRATTQTPDGYWTIDTDAGSVSARHLVNAAGFHARDVGKLAGLSLPIVAVQHQYAVTAEVPEVKQLQREIPVLRDLENSYYLRQEKHGLLIGPYEPEDKMQLCEEWYNSGVPDSFGRELFQPDLERLMPQLEAAMQRVPALASAPIQVVVNGPITYNAENAGLIGPVSSLSNYWLAVGLGYGIAHGGGVGQYLSEWITNGEPSYDLTELDANRYGWWADKKFLMAKARETYGWNNAVGWPHEDRPAGRPTVRASGRLRDLLEAEGAQFGFSNGWEVPLWYAKESGEFGHAGCFRRGHWFGAVQRECRTVTDAAGVVFLSAFAKFRIRGQAAAEFLDTITANYLPKLNRTCLTHALTPRGRIFAELTLTRTQPEEFLCVTGSTSEQHDLAWLQRWARELGYANLVTIDNVTDSLACVGIAGPQSRLALQPLTSCSLSAENFSFMSAKSADVGGVECLAIRVSYTGELGWELYCPAPKASELYSACLSAVKGVGGGCFGAYAMQSLRIEKGFGAWGAEFNCDNTPQEAGLDRFVRIGKRRQFIGKQAATDAAKSAVRLRLLKLQCPDVDPEGNEAIWLGDKVIGHTTSGCYGFNCGHSLAFAYVPSELEAGSEVSVELLGERLPAVVMEMPPQVPHHVRRSVETNREGS